MRYLVISDIHANLEAFKAVLQDAQGQWDCIWCLGDIVGYGPNPNECMALLREHNHLSLSGNHDWAVLGKLDIESFNAEARTAIRWTQGAINDETRQYLSQLPPSAVDDPFTLVHASPRQPVWEYILDERTAAQNLAYFDTPYCLVGHSHVPLLFAKVSPDRCRLSPPAYGEPITLGEQRLIINPGSVGQPRDSDPRAAYGLLDSESMTWEHHRIAYDVAETQGKMRENGMPYRLVARLQVGW
ncbi:MAG TPA: metallophosphoesterase family protein [Candidatus Binatia bacterium]|jgi:diadenosine tetraphosphatase ApaH/serine/threonine PP2A family protein phosphatase|nr:metallophosphoesterase family protein [Candidatus Binatia bacterium]